jgi:polyhydroxyalkanoate synthesis regulator phasin
MEYMVKLTNKEHEQQQQNRIKKLENDLKQQKSRIDTLETRINSLENRKTLKKTTKK